MADDTADVTDSPKQQSGGGKSSLADQALSALTKASKDAVIAKLKDIFRKKIEAQRAVALCDAEAAKLIEDFEKGLI
jgi:hypothetical protein